MTSGADHHVALAGKQLVDRRRKGRQGRPRSGVQGHSAAHKIERLGNPRSQRARRETAGFVEQGGHSLQENVVVAAANGFNLRIGQRAAPERIDQLATEFGQAQANLQLRAKVAAKNRADHRTHAFPVVGPAIVAGIADGRVGRFENHELQRIGVGDLFRRHFVTLPVVDEVGNEPAPIGGQLPRFCGIVTPRQIAPPTIGRHATLGVPAAFQQLPEGFRRLGPRQNTTDTDHGHRVTVRRRRHGCRRRQGGLRGSVGPGGLGCGGGSFCRFRGRIPREEPAPAGFLAELVDHNMDIQAADAEGIDRSPSRMAVKGSRPRDIVPRNKEGGVVPIDALVEILDVDLPRNHLVLHGQDDFEQAGHAGGLQGMADVCLHAADRDLRAPRQPVAQGFSQRRHFRDVAGLGRGGVGLDELQPAHVEAGAVSPPHGFNLPLDTRSPEAFSPAVGGHANAANHGMNAVAVRTGPVEGLHDHDNLPFPGDETIGGGIKRPRAAGRDRPGLGEQDQRTSGNIGGPAHQGHVDRPSPQRPPSDGKGLERRRAGPIEGYRRTGQLQCLGDDRGCETGRKGKPFVTAVRKPPPHFSGAFALITARPDPWILPRKPPANLRDDLPDNRILLRWGECREIRHFAQVLRCFIDAGRVAQVACHLASQGMADKNTRVANGQVKGVHARIAACLRSHLADRSLHDIGRREKGQRQGTLSGVETWGIQQGRFLGVSPAEFAGHGIVVQALIESIGRHIFDCATPFDQQLPIFGKCCCFGEAAGHTDNRQRFALGHSVVTVLKVGAVFHRCQLGIALGELLSFRFSSCEKLTPVPVSRGMLFAAEELRSVEIP